MSRKRRSYESGHKAKYLVIIDNSPECDRAIYYASRRVARTQATMIMLRVIETEDRNQQWLGVADIMRAEAHEEANAALDRAAGRANGVAGITPERVIREGRRIRADPQADRRGRRHRDPGAGRRHRDGRPRAAGFGHRPHRRRVSRFR